MRTCAIIHPLHLELETAAPFQRDSLKIIERVSWLAQRRLIFMASMTGQDVLT
jgi:hypothetical protein